jgi:polyribonucleotide nucleotidyltransferase
MKLGGRELSIETGKMAKQADGAAVVQYGGTVVLGTVVASREPRVDTDYLPLFVEYREKTYAAGRIPGGFFKREGRPTEKEILSARLIDRPLRPLFPHGFRNEVQIIVTVLSADQENDPDILGIIAASSALALSDIPFPVSIGALRVGRVNGESIICPTHKQIDDGGLDLVIAGVADKVLMVEGCAKEVEEGHILEALRLGLEEVDRVSSLIEEFKKKCGKEKKEIGLIQVDKEVQKAVEDFVKGKIEEVITIPDKNKREMFVSHLISEASEHFGEDRIADIKTVVDEIQRELIRRHIFSEGKRVDGRTSEELRPISCEVGLLPRTHGSALFTRGETQSLSVTTLGTAEDEQMMEELKGESSKSFMLHYNFPPFSVGEVRPVRGPGRREVGHGALAERALRSVLPSSEEFPYTIRIVSDILESNGSSSMATVCGGCLALMDAGVPIKAAVAGIAMGLVKEDDKAVLLTVRASGKDSFCL